MAYDPTVWKSGDTITSAKLNKLENGLAEASGGGTGGGVLKISVTEQAGGTQAVMDKTWAEINEAAFSVVVMSFAEGENTWMPVVGTDEDGKLYNVTVAFPQNEHGLITFQEKDFFTNSETGYPGMPLG